MLLKFKNEDGVDRKEEKNIWSQIRMGMRWRRQGLMKKGLSMEDVFLVEEVREIS